MKSSEEMTENVIKRLNEHREKVKERNSLTEKFTDSEEMKGVGFMNRKFSLIATTSSVFLVMAVIFSIISLNMKKPDLNDETEMSNSLLISATNAENSKETSDMSVSEQVSPVRTTVAPATCAEKKVETVKTAKTTYLGKTTQPTAVKEIESSKAEETVQTEEPIKTEEQIQTEEPIKTEAVEKTEIPQTEKPIQTEEPVQTTVNPVTYGNIFQLTPSTDGVEEFMELFREKYGNDGRGDCYNVTPQEITDKYDIRIFKFDNDGGGNLYGEGFLLYENEIYILGESFGGWGLTSFAVADIDHNGSNELYFTYSWGSGIHRSHIAYFDTQSKDIAVFDYVYWDYDMILSNKNGVLSICHAEPIPLNFIQATAGKEIGRIEFIDNEIQLALIED